MKVLLDWERFVEFVEYKTDDVFEMSPHKEEVENILRPFLQSKTDGVIEIKYAQLDYKYRTHRFSVSIDNPVTEIEAIYFIYENNLDKKDFEELESRIQMELGEDFIVWSVINGSYGNDSGETMVMVCKKKLKEYFQTIVLSERAVVNIDKHQWKKQQYRINLDFIDNNRPSNAYELRIRDTQKGEGVSITFEIWVPSDVIGYDPEKDSLILTLYLRYNGLLGYQEKTRIVVPVKIGSKVQEIENRLIDAIVENIIKKNNLSDI